MNQNRMIILLLILYVLMFGLVGRYEVRLAELDIKHDEYKILKAEKYVWKQIAEANISQASSLAPKYTTLTVTAYTNRPQETNDCIKTATMEQAVPGWTVAVSRDLIHWLGGRVYIEGVGVRRVNDLMNVRHKRTLDLLVGTVDEAVEWGKKERTIVYLGL